MTFFIISTNLAHVVAVQLKVWLIFFLSYSFFGSIRGMVLHWLNFVSVQPASITDHFNQFRHLRGSSQILRLSLHLIWASCAWVTWNERNRRNFKHSELSMKATYSLHQETRCPNLYHFNISHWYIINLF